jgi:hypothetical protein
VTDLPMRSRRIQPAGKRVALAILIFCTVSYGLMS